MKRGSCWRFLGQFGRPGGDGALKSLGFLGVCIPTKSPVELQRLSHFLMDGSMVIPSTQMVIFLIISLFRGYPKVQAVLDGWMESMVISKPFFPWERVEKIIQKRWPSIF